MINSRVIFTGKPNQVLHPAQVVQQPPQSFIQRSLPPQNVSFIPQGYVAIRPQGSPEVANQQLPSITQQQQPVVITNQRAIVSQGSVTSFNPTQVVQQNVLLTEQRDDSRLQQQTTIPQNIEFKEEVKPAEPKNTSVPSTQTNGYKTYKTNSW